MNEREAKRLNDVALNIIDLAHCLHTGAANEISFEKWKDMFARSKNYEAARKQWRDWKKSLDQYGLSENVQDGREGHVILKREALEVAEGLRADAQAVLGKGKVTRRYPDQVTIGGRTFYLKVFGRAVRPLTDREYTELKANIEAKGRIEVPIIVDPRGRVVDGKHRLTIAEELGLEDVPVQVVEGTDDELHDLAEDLNTCRRQFTRRQLAELKRQRQARAEAQRAAFKSLRQIAEEEGVNPMTIRRDLAATACDQEMVLGRDGRLQPARKPSKEEADERRRRVAELRAEEKTLGQIAETLGVSTRTVRRDLRALRGETANEHEDDSRGGEGFGIVVQEVRVGETSWLGVDREADPLEACLEAALSCLEQVRERLDDTELNEMVTESHKIVESVLWRLLEGAAG